MLRSLGSIRKYAQEYQSHRSTLSRGKYSSAAPYKNCIAAPLIEYEDNVLVLDVIPPMELHLMLGVVNRLYDYLDKALEESASSIKAKDWADLLYIERRHYHGGQFIGNHCSKLLDEVDILEQLLIESGAYIGIPYVEAFRKFKIVKDMCFGYHLYEGYDTAVKNFKTAYLNLDIPVSLKVHIVFDHIVQFCEKYSTGLGLFSEHALESSHYNFKPFWEKSYKVAMNHPIYGQKILDSVHMYNALHV